MSIDEEAITPPRKGWVRIHVVVYASDLAQASCRSKDSQVAHIIHVRKFYSYTMWIVCWSYVQLQEEVCIADDISVLGWWGPWVRDSAVSITLYILTCDRILASSKKSTTPAQKVRFEKGASTTIPLRGVLKKPEVVIPK